MCAKRNETKEKYIKTIYERNEFLYSISDKIAFNFKFFTYGADSGQSFEEWQRDEILADLNNKLKDYSGKTVLELLQDKTLEIYSEYPKGSKFTQPPMLTSAQIEWCRLRLTGRRRLIGFFYKVSDVSCKNIFYIVFLDKNHDFAPSRQK